MTTEMSTLAAAADLETRLEKLEDKREAALEKVDLKFAELERKLIADYAPEAVALYRRLQSEKSKAEGKAT